MKKAIKKVAKKVTKKVVAKKVAPKKVVKKIAKINHVKPVVKPKKVVKKLDMMESVIEQRLKGKTKTAAKELGLDFSKSSMTAVFKKESDHFKQVGSNGVSQNDLKPEYLNIYTLMQLVYENVDSKLTSQSPVVITVTAKKRRKI